MAHLAIGLPHSSVAVSSDSNKISFDLLPSVVLPLGVNGTILTPPSGEDGTVMRPNTLNAFQRP
jgi:hypothetical protein